MALEYNYNEVTVFTRVEHTHSSMTQGSFFQPTWQHMVNVGNLFPVNVFNIQKNGLRISRPEDREGKFKNLMVKFKSKPP